MNKGLEVAARGGVAEWSCSGLQSRLRRFDSDPRLQSCLHCLGYPIRMTPTLPPSPLHGYGGAWQARLDLRVERREFGEGLRSCLVNSKHVGPLRIQKPLWPEGPHPLHLLLLHPPGGLAGGDQLRVRLELGEHAQCLITTPGAGKFYKADTPSLFDVDIHLNDGASLEWLPQETIVHDGTQAESQLRFQLHANSRALACDVVVLGRRESGEQFTHGEFKQCLQIHRDGRLLFDDTTVWRAEYLRQRVAMGAQAHVSALFWAARPEAWHEDEVEQLEIALDQAALANLMSPSHELICGVSQVIPGLLLVRVLGTHAEGVRKLMHQAWAHLRPQVLARQASLPRIWNT
jgi:urease accessory protein